MNSVETIQQKVFQLPPKAQAEVLEIIEQIEQRYQTEDTAEDNRKQNGEAIHPLTLIAKLSVDVGVTDLAERHDYYAHGKLED